MKKIAIGLSIFLLTSGCATIKPIVQGPAKIENSMSFEVGKEKKTRIGMPMVEQVYLIYKEGLITKEAVTPPSNKLLALSFPTIPKGTYFRPYGEASTGEIVYWSDQYKLIANSSFGPIHYCLSANKNKQVVGIVSCTSGLGGMRWAEGSAYFKEGKAVKEGSWKKEIIYNGKSGNVIKLTYREYTNNMIRSDFNQELTYDLKEGQNISFQTMDLKVLKATNSNIKFIVKTPLK